jgi:Fungal protein of unknown function (DUF1752)/Nitrogen regulatory protein AreA N terminus
MSTATNAERGGHAAIRAAALQLGADDSVPMEDADLLNYSAPDDTSQTFALRPTDPELIPNARGLSTRTQSGLGGGKLDLSPQETIARNGLLRESVFPDWEDDAAGSGIGSPDEMQKKDPLATQIWKLYSKTKTRLPNQERMENLTWRMMAMSLKRREQMQAMLVLEPLLFANAFTDTCFIGHNRASLPLPVELRRCTSRATMSMRQGQIP